MLRRFATAVLLCGLAAALPLAGAAGATGPTSSLPTTGAQDRLPDGATPEAAALAEGLNNVGDQIEALPRFGFECCFVWVSGSEGARRHSGCHGVGADRPRKNRHSRSPREAGLRP